ncbi:MAG: ATP-dependent metallopeptidase FtsH/Yme1/Tma family protein [Deltaproteobacteria bacterium]|nr:ATP-dependent metallopeptidase FtsH/Yme1/Tma family protein [Deltaproteobacteria bacterium]
MKQTQKTFALWAVIILLVLSAVMIFEPKPKPDEISWNEFLSAVQQNQIAEISISEDEYAGKFKSEYDNGSHFFTIGPVNSEFVQRELQKTDAKWNYQKPAGTPFWQQFLVYLPVLIIVFGFIYLFRSMQVGGGKALSFGKSKAQLLNENSRKVTFKDVAGVEESKEELQEIIEFLKEPRKFVKLGARIPKGVLLMGPPGTGKTLLARAVAGEASVPFYSISGSDFVEMFVGVGASRVRDLFEQGKKNAPCIIFIDEIDAVGRHRGSGLGGGHDEREQTLNQLLVEMDGFESNEGVIIIAATNRPDVLDPALLRPGRFDRRIVVAAPDLNGREAILKIHAAKVPLESDVDLMSIARGTPGFCGADLENLVNEAALQAARDNKKKVAQSDLELAKDKVLMGSERRSMLISDDEKKITAYHEAGHTLVAELLPDTDPVHKVTIIPRGRALGLTQQLPEQDRYSQSKEYSESMISVLMGGRIAEEVVFNQVTTGASNDIERATEIARKMVCYWGMSDNLGPVKYGSDDQNVFLGKEMGMHHQSDYSDVTAKAIDEEVRSIVLRNYDRALNLVKENHDKLDNLAKALIEFEVLDAEQIRAAIAGEKVKAVAKPSGSGGSEDKKEEKESKTVIAPEGIASKPGLQGA